MSEVTLARIRETTLGFEDHGLLTAFLHLEYADKGGKIGGSGQGFGGRILSGEFTDYWIRGVLTAVGVNDWSMLPGRMVWADHDWDAVHTITGLDTGKTFDPRQREGVS